VVSNLPLAIFESVNKGVTGLDNIPSSAQGKLVDTSVLAPVVTNMNVRLEDFSLGFLLQKVVKVINDSSLVGPWNITDSRKEASIGGVACCNGLGVKSRKGRVPELEESSDFFFVDFLGDVQVLGHDRRMMMGNLPLLVFVYVGVSVTSLDLVTSSSHGELVDTTILGPIGSNPDITF